MKQFPLRISNTALPKTSANLSGPDCQNTGRTLAHTFVITGPESLSRNHTRANCYASKKMHLRPPSAAKAGIPIEARFKLVA